MIKQLIAKNYKSLEDVTLSLRPLNVLVGPNNSGKSNILDCLLFLKEMAEQGAPAINVRGGFKDMVWGGDLRRTITLEVRAEVRDGAEYPLSYRLIISGGPAHYHIAGETCYWYYQGFDTPKWNALLQFPEKGTYQAVIRDKFGQEISKLEPDPLGSTLVRFGEKHEILGFFVKELRSWAVYDLVASTMTEPGPVKRELHLDHSGRNLSVVLHTLRVEFPESFQEIERILTTAAIPEVKALLTPLLETGGTYLAWQEKGLPAKIPAWSMPDGSLRLLALLAVLCSPEPPSLVCIEEPENCIHPHLLELVADLLKSASEKTQILITTHSPYLLNFVPPESLIVVEKEEGKTKIKELHPDEAIKKALKVLGLGEIYYSGHLGGVP